MADLHESHLADLRRLEDLGYRFVIGSDGYEVWHKRELVFRHMRPLPIGKTVPALEELVKRAKEHEHKTTGR